MIDRRENRCRLIFKWIGHLENNRNVVEKKEENATSESKRIMVVDFFFFLDLIKSLSFKLIFVLLKIEK